MSLRYAPNAVHRRGSSCSTVRANAPLVTSGVLMQDEPVAVNAIHATLWVHDDAFSHDEVLINPAIIEGSAISEGSLVQILPLHEMSDVKDFQDSGSSEPTIEGVSGDVQTGQVHPAYLCIVKLAPAELLAKQPGLEVMVTSSIAAAFDFRPRSQITVSVASFGDNTASHVELGFRDAYVARSDMWRLVSHELAGSTLYVGQKVSFLGTLKVTVKAIHVKGRRVRTAYFAGVTVPVFRSEAARYVIFIQMSREMWDFDSDGKGEILFNRVINGFLPDLFGRWTELEVKHMVSIVLFGRLEYDRYDLAVRKGLGTSIVQSSSTSNSRSQYYEDFYRVVVTDMASAQWTTILDELKKDFRVFLRDMSLHTRDEGSERAEESTQNGLPKTTIAGRPSSALKGNILEAIHMASSQFANDYIDRDLIRTGISVAVITAGTGVFEVDRDLLNLTSENLTNNGLGIDVVCLSKMPLHSVPLFKYRVSNEADQSTPEIIKGLSTTPLELGSSFNHSSMARSLSHSPALSSLGSTSTNVQHFSRYPSSLRVEDSRTWCYGIPQWVDLSYWSPDDEKAYSRHGRDQFSAKEDDNLARKGPFVPRVRMYEMQMMGLMELGLADIAIPFLSETHRKWSSENSLSKYNSKSMSISPALSRKSRSSVLRSKRSQGLLMNHAETASDVSRRMEEYDEALYKSPRRHLSKKQPMQKKLAQPLSTSTADAPLASPKLATSSRGTTKDALATLKTPSQALQLLGKKPAGKDGLTTSKRTPASAKMSRNLSYALRGLAPPVRAVAQTEINVENAQAQPVHNRPATARRTLTSSSASILSLTPGTNHDNDSDTTTLADFEASRSAHSHQNKATRPISINVPGRSQIGEHTSTRRRSGSFEEQSPRTRDNTIDLERTQVKTNKSQPSSDNESENGSKDTESQFGSVPRSTMPFIRNVNAANPLKRHPERESLYGRWQHLYPRKPRAATVKWRSLCTPASVPLTTADFPTRADLEANFDSSSYVVTLGKTDELAEVPGSLNTLLQEMLALRLAHGYQLVVGSAVEESAGPGLCRADTFFNPDILSQSGHFMFLSMGNTIQKLSFSDQDSINVTRFVRRMPEMQPPYPRSLTYTPNIKTILSEAFFPRTMELRGFSEQYPWAMADQYLANARKELENSAEQLRFWRARFVLLPIEPPINTWSGSRPAHPRSEEEAEEIHLLGIRALTQLWQRSRYIPPDERRPTHNRLSMIRRKDPNPLQIDFKTLNPSEVVVTELDRLLAAQDYGENSGETHTTHLLPESELFDRESAVLSKLAQAVQGEKGIEIKHRRWHLKLHYNCFHGEEFTNWLLHNFRDINTREEAVDFGNELMTEGLFNHVNGLHNFKDGHYFYSINPEHRAPRADLKSSWFPGSRRSERSVPPTPMSENPFKEFPFSTGRNRSGSSQANETPLNAPNTAKGSLERKRITIELSKMIRIDVDSRRRSSRHEIINLHYDRIHNPDNCYHLELSWFNVTSKLVDDAIISWTTQAEKYGLKLVEVPIAEASAVYKTEPFRAPYRIRLALEPPRSVSMGNPYFTATSFGPHPAPTPELHHYQKALLKHFNFVLDLEAVSEFPENVDIQYSWGKLDYQYTQFVHRSGVGLAQISDEGDILLLANRLYNSRFASTKDTSSKFDKQKDGIPHHLRQPQPSMQASGIIGLNPQSPMVGPSPMMRASADVLPGSKAVPNSSTVGAYVTPEQIKNELEAFCHDKDKLHAFYKGVTAEAAAATTTAAPKKTASTSSSVLRPIREPDPFIPDLRLPESVSSAMSTVMSSARRVVSAERGEVSVRDIGGGNRSLREKDKGSDSPRRKPTGG